MSKVKCPICNKEFQHLQKHISQSRKCRKRLLNAHDEYTEEESEIDDGNSNIPDHVYLQNNDDSIQDEHNDQNNIPVDYIESTTCRRSTRLQTSTVAQGIHMKIKYTKKTFQIIIDANG